ncbi:unnamed protein product [Citrullus colocynthis]|uniref:Uncharacterized protein n=1 Tax=Citrullus colocynthis TaxID=252529 RepID=A0ABP0XS55_9ROSI
MYYSKKTFCLEVLIGFRVKLGWPQGRIVEGYHGVTASKESGGNVVAMEHTYFKAKMLVIASFLRGMVEA